MFNVRFPPASFFGIPLGLAGLGLAWRAAIALWHLPGWISEAILAVAVALWSLLVALYASGSGWPPALTRWARSIIPCSAASSGWRR
jgi:tellurite resistance protein TehA-like permease